MTLYIAAVNRDIPDLFATIDSLPKTLHGDRKNFGLRLKMLPPQKLKLALSCNMGQVRSFSGAISLKTKLFLFGTFCRMTGYPVGCVKWKRKQGVTVNILE